VTKRIAISLPDELFHKVERLRRRSRTARSTWIQEAVGDYVKRVDEEALEKAYFDGYRRIPDANDEDFEAIERAAIRDMRDLKG
jgi:metal-responsive CopG/Arc/MetJ family transcriptional regulator